MEPSTRSMFLSIFSLILITCSSASPHNHFQILNVTATLHQALKVFSPKHQQPHLHNHNNNTSSLSITLHSRSSLPFNNHHHHSNYTSLSLSRLARDSARVNSLSCRSCKSLPLNSGISQGSGEYFARVGLGRPTREYYMVLDTGSDVSWLQSQPCVSCYMQSDPIYNPATSSTYHPLPCMSRQCAALRNSDCLAGRCMYDTLYGDGSSTFGNFATETVSFGSSGSVPDVANGFGHVNIGLYSGAAGLLGLGGGQLSLASQLKATSFSYCLVNRDSSSSSTLEFNSSEPADSVMVPLVANPTRRTYRYVALTGISVGGRPVRFPASLFEIRRNGEGGVIIDSGTTVTRLPTEAYDAVRNEFRQLNRRLPFAGGFSLLDTCYDLSSYSTVRVPTVSLQFAGGKTVALPASNYMIPVDGRGIVCFAFAGTSESPFIIGNVQQQGMRITYDLGNRVVGFSPNKC